MGAVLFAALLVIGGGLWWLCHEGSRRLSENRDHRQRDVQLQRMTYAAVMQMLTEARRQSSDAPDAWR